LNEGPTINFSIQFNSIQFNSIQKTKNKNWKEMKRKKKKEKEPGGMTGFEACAAMLFSLNLNLSL
jgi:hypothetical protein